jgi:hypothetical protein
MSEIKSPGAVAAHGALEIDQLGSAVNLVPTPDGKSSQSTCAKPISDHARPVDPRLAFLLRAAARFALVEAGELDLEEAFNGLMSALRWGADDE